MAETKYGKYLTKDIFRPRREGGIMASTRQLESFIGGNYSLDCFYQTKPFVATSEPHKHEFDQYLCLLGAGNLDDISEFDAEIHFSLGEDHEKQIITEPTLFYIPAGLAHGPLEFVKVNKPVLMIDVSLTSTYKRKSEAGEIQDYEGKAFDGGKKE